MSQDNKSFKLLFVDISKQFKELNKHFIWLLIATIGCWGIPSAIAQPIAILLVFLITVFQLEQFLKIIFKKYNAIKDLYGLVLTANRLKFVKRKMRQLVIQQIWISISCLIFVFLSFFLIGVKLGSGLATAHKSGKILEFFLSM